MSKGVTQTKSAIKRLPIFKPLSYAIARRYGDSNLDESMVRTCLTQREGVYGYYFGVRNAKLFKWTDHGLMSVSDNDRFMLSYHENSCDGSSWEFHINEMLIQWALNDSYRKGDILPKQSIDFESDGAKVSQLTLNNRTVYIDGDYVLVAGVTVPGLGREVPFVWHFQLIRLWGDLFTLLKNDRAMLDWLKSLNPKVFQKDPQQAAKIHAQRVKQVELMMGGLLRYGPDDGLEF